MGKYSEGDKVISVKDTQDVPEGFIGFVVETGQECFEYTVVSAEGKSECFHEDELELLSVGNQKETKPDLIQSPKHYSVFEKVEAIQVIASSMTQDQFYGYCFGNILKYRLRAGGKDDVMQELGKADRYQGLYNENKHLCKVG
jgi:hypothetical protein